MDVSNFDAPSRIALTAGAGFAISNRPKSTYNPSTQSSYVLHLARLHSSCYAASFSAPSHSIALLDKSSLKLVTAIKGAHADTITQMRCPPYLSTYLGKDVLVSSGRDGLVKTWDTRSASGHECVLQFDDKRGILSFDVSSDGLTIAAGTELKGDEAHLIFWDVRNATTPTHISTSAHSDDITSLSYHPSTPHLLLSASTDGLLCTTDAREVDEDESTVDVGNWGCSVAKAGWTGASAARSGVSQSSQDMDVEDASTAAIPGVWAHSDMQTLSTWSESVDLISDYGDLRKPVLDPQWPETDYFIDATWLSGGASDLLAWGSAGSAGTGPGATGLGVWVGRNNGDVALLRTDNAESWKLEKILSGSHTDVVRSVLWDEENSIILTGGEDAIISAWAVPRSAGSGSLSSFSSVSNLTLTTKNDVDEDDGMDVDDAPAAPRGSKRSRDREGEDGVERPVMTKRVKSMNKLSSRRDR